MIEPAMEGAMVTRVPVSAPVSAAGTSAGETVIRESEIIDSKTFTKTVDHEVLIEKKEYILEHRPIQETVRQRNTLPVNSVRQIASQYTRA